MFTTVRLPFSAADPFIMRASDGMYYLYCTTEDSTGLHGTGFPVRCSRDLWYWTDCGVALSRETARWSVDNFWAPECYEIDGRYYLFYSADWKENPSGALENFRIGVAVSDKPAGPFEDMSDRPIFDPGYPVIDANLLIDGGRFYLYYSRCCTPVSPGRAAPPLGPFVKAQENPILERYGSVTGTGHGCMLRRPEGELLICYHGRTEKTGNDRIGFISPAGITEDHRLVIHP